MKTKLDYQQWIRRQLERMTPKEHQALLKSDTTELRALGVDSLGLMVLLADLCRAYDIDVDAIDASNIRVYTVGDLTRAAGQILNQST